MSVSVEELVVSIREEGLGQTTEGLNEMEQQFDETAQSVEESSGELSDYADKFQGAMGAIVGGLAVAAAGLMSQIPVLGGLMSGVASVVSAVAYQMDKVLRPVLQPVTNGFYKLSSAIFQLDGPLGTLVGVIGTVVAILAVAIPAIAAIGSVLGVFGSTVGGVVSIVGTLVAALGALVSLPALIVAAIALLIAAFAVDFMGIRTKTIEAVKGVIDWLGNLASGFGKWAGKIASKAGDLVSGVIDEFAGWGESLLDTLGDFIDYIMGTGSGSLIGDIKSGFQSVLDWISGTLGGLFQTAWDGVLEGVEIGKNIANTIIQGINTAIPNSFSFEVPEIWVHGHKVAGGNTISADLPKNPIPQVQSGGLIEEAGLAMLHAGERVVPRAQVNDRGEMPLDMDAGGGFRANRRESPTVVMDGRELTKQDGRYRDDQTSRRGVD
jgi:hypothetical protein